MHQVKTISQSKESSVLGGKHYDEGKLRMDLIPPEAMEALAGVLTYGASKYDERNWEKGVLFSKLYGSLLRHLTAFWKGIDIDAESGLPHLHHALCNISFMVTLRQTMPECDDRPCKSRR